MEKLLILAGAKWFRFLSTFRRVSGRNAEVVQQYRKAKKRHIQKVGIRKKHAGIG